MPKTREADFYLGCLDSCVFIDFNLVENDQIELVRISFDGYGCCNLGPKVEPLSREESALFVEELSKDSLDQEVITGLVKKAIKINEERIWNDALKKYDLIE